MISGQTRGRGAQALAAATIAVQPIVIVDWLVVGAIEGHGYSAGRHDISDLGALTAHYVWWLLPIEAAAGLVAIAFAIGPLRSALMGAMKREPFGVWLVALSLPALDNLGDLVFRLDCRAADGGCAATDSIASWHGTMHVIVYFVATVATLIAPFALARRMRTLSLWRDFAGGAQRVGVLIIAVVLVSSAFEGSGWQGWTERIEAVAVSLALVPLAWRVLRLPATSQSTRTPPAHDLIGMHYDRPGCG